MNTQIFILFLFTLIPKSFGGNETCKYGQVNCQPNIPIKFNEQKLYFIISQKKFVCMNQNLFQCDDPINNQNFCLFKFKHIEHGYYTIQSFAHNNFVSTCDKKLDENTLLCQYSQPIDNFMQFKFIHSRDGWYEVLVRRTSKVWSTKANQKEIYQTSERTQGTNQLFKVEEYND